MVLMSRVWDKKTAAPILRNTIVKRRGQQEA